MLQMSRHVNASYLILPDLISPLYGVDHCVDLVLQVDSERGTGCDSKSDGTIDSTTNSDFSASSSSTLEYVTAAATTLAETCKSLQGAFEKEQGDISRRIDEQRKASDDLREELARERMKNEALIVSEVVP